MSVFGKMRFNTVFSTDKEDLLAASEWECMALLITVMIVTTISYILDRYNNEKQSGDIEFRMWDASTGKTYLATPTPERTITFL